MRTLGTYTVCAWHIAQAPCYARGSTRSSAFTYKFQANRSEWLQSKPSCVTGKGTHVFTKARHDKKGAVQATPMNSSNNNNNNNRTLSISNVNTMMSAITSIATKIPNHPLPNTTGTEL